MVNQWFIMITNCWSMVQNGWNHQLFQPVKSLFNRNCHSSHYAKNNQLSSVQEPYLWQNPRGVNAMGHCQPTDPSNLTYNVSTSWVLKRRGHPQSRYPKWPLLFVVVMEQSIWPFSVPKDTLFDGQAHRLSLSGSSYLCFATSIHTIFCWCFSTIIGNLGDILQIKVISNNCQQQSIETIELHYVQQSCQYR